MKAKDIEAECCKNGDISKVSCRVESVLSVDERGQMVLPKELREEAGIAPGDKLAVTTLRRGPSVVCLVLSKANDLAPKLEELLRPVFLRTAEEEADER